MNAQPDPPELIAPQWLHATKGRSVNWQDENRRLHLLAKILLEQRRKQPTFKPNRNTKVVEIISEGIRDNEPLWHGLKIQLKAKLFRSDEIKDLKKRVKCKRDLIGSHLNTHYLMCRLFYRPVLLGIHQQARGCEIKCYVHIGEAWEELEKAKNLPLKVRIDGQSSTDAANEIADHLRLLHDRVLWPAFFTDIGKPAQRQSLVLLHASSWRVLGVWALHAQGTDLLEPNLIEPADLMRTVIHPMGAMNDVFGAMVASQS